MNQRFDEILAALEARTDVSGLLAGDPKRIDGIRGVHDESLLHFCAIENKVASVRKLIEMGADPNVRSKYGSTPLMDAAMVGNEEVVRVLLEAGADINARNNIGETVLELLELLKHRQSLKEMIQRYARDDSGLLVVRIVHLRDLVDLFGEKESWAVFGV